MVRVLNGEGESKVYRVRVLSSKLPTNLKKK